MTNERINQIITEEIAAAKLPENVSIETTFYGNGAYIAAFDTTPTSFTFNVTYAGVTTTKTTTHHTHSQIGFCGEEVWGIQGEQRVREIVRKYLAEVNC